MPVDYLTKLRMSLQFSTLGLLLFIPSTLADDLSKFHLHQEGSGSWVIEASEIQPETMERIASNLKETGNWFIQRVPSENEVDKTPIEIQGKWLGESGRLLFRPKYPFREGQQFQVVELHDFDRPQIKFSFRIPADGGPEPMLVRLEPDLKVWPENLLRLYLHFNRPMSRGEANTRILMKDEKGRELVQPFLQLDQELWDKEGKRLTILFDPGRVKQGLKPREEDGAILENGHHYTIEISAGWPDARGIVTENKFEQKFKVGPADLKPIEPRKWKIIAPKPTEDSLLTIEFDSPIDTGMALRLIQILESGECPLDGQMEISDDGMSLKFNPRVKWSPGLHFIEVNPALEDPSGNQVGRPFERDIQSGEESLMNAAKPVRLTFIVNMLEE